MSAQYAWSLIGDKSGPKLLPEITIFHVQAYTRAFLFIYLFCRNTETTEMEMDAS